MDKDTKVFLGRILGELLVVKARTAPGRFSPNVAVPYGLLNGFESTIDEVIQRTGFISKAKEDAVMEILDEHWNDQAKLKAFTGFYQIEDDLSSRGVSRSDAITILQKLKAEGRFSELIEKIQEGTHGGSPIELHRLDVKADEL